MNAKILNRLIVAVIALLTVCPVLADTGSSQNFGTPGNGSTKLKQQSPCPKAKRMPSSLYLEREGYKRENKHKVSNWLTNILIYESLEIPIINSHGLSFFHCIWR